MQIRGNHFRNNLFISVVRSVVCICVWLGWKEKFLRVAIVLLYTVFFNWQEKSTLNVQLDANCISISLFSRVCENVLVWCEIFDLHFNFVLRNYIMECEFYTMKISQNIRFIVQIIWKYQENWPYQMHRSFSTNFQCSTKLRTNFKFLYHTFDLQISRCTFYTTDHIKKSNYCKMFGHDNQFAHIYEINFLLLFVN